MFPSYVTLFLFTTTANVMVVRNFYSPPVSEQEYFLLPTRKTLAFFFNLLMCLTVQCYPRCSVRTSNTSHVAGPGVPYGSENM